PHPTPLISPLFPYTTLFRSVVPALRDRPFAGGVRNRRARRGVSALRDLCPERSRRAHHGERRAASRGGAAARVRAPRAREGAVEDRKSTRLNSSHQIISYAV